MLNNKGFAILFAVILVSIVLAISLSLFNITIRQIILSLVARDTQIALFAADSGRECAEYWDRLPNENQPFGYYINTAVPTLEEPYPSPSYEFTEPNQNVSTISCGAGRVQNPNVNGSLGVAPRAPFLGGDYYVSTFDTFFPDNSERKYCARVTVYKQIVSGSSDEGQTVVTSEGFSSYPGSPIKCGEGPDERTVTQMMIGSYGGITGGR